MNQPIAVSWSKIAADSIRLFRSHFEDFIQPITINILMGVIVTAINFFSFPYDSTISFVFGVFSVFVSFWLMIVMIKISHRVISGNTPSLPETYQESTSQFLSFFATVLMVGLICFAVSILVFVIFSFLLSLVLPFIVHGDPAQFLTSLDESLKNTPEKVFGLLTAGFSLAILAGIAAFVAVATAWVRYSFAIVDAAVSDSKISIMERMGRCEKITRGRWKFYLPAIILPLVLITVFEAVVALGVGSIITAGRYGLLELSGNIYYNILSLVITGLLSPIMYLIWVRAYQTIYNAPQTANHE